MGFEAQRRCGDERGYSRKRCFGRNTAELLGNKPIPSKLIPDTGRLKVSALQVKSVKAVACRGVHVRRAGAQRFHPTPGTLAGAKINYVNGRGYVWCGFVERAGQGEK